MSKHQIFNKNELYIQQASFAVITIGLSENKQFLLQWNSKWKMFNLIGGKLDNKKGDKNSFSRAIMREIEEELGADCLDKILRVREVSQIYLRQFSYREQRIKEYHFAIFAVKLISDINGCNNLGAIPFKSLQTSPENIFVSWEEINDLKTKDGRIISPTTYEILSRI